MNTTIEPTKIEKDTKPTSGGRRGLLINLSLFLVVSFFLVVNAYWKWIDGTVPVWDSASHLQYGYKIADLLRYSPDIFTGLDGSIKASFYYPPLFYFTHALVGITVGELNTVVDQIPSLAFFVISLVALYKLGCELLEDKKIALLGVFLFACSPAVSKAVHPVALLDLPLTAMVFTGFYALVRWRKNPSWLMALLSGLAIGLTALAKQYGFFFFIPVMAFWFFEDIKNKNFRNIKMILSQAFIAASVFLVWLVPNLPSLLPFMSKNHRPGAEGDFLLMWLNNMKEILDLFPESLTTIGLVAFLLSIATFEVHKKLWILSVPCLFCMGAICLLNWDPYQFRYILPVVGYTSLATAWLIHKTLLTSPKALLRYGGYSLVLYFLFAFLYLNFTPYPVKASPLLDKIPSFNTIKSKSYYTEPIAPIPKKDRGYDWLFSTIEKHKFNKQSEVVETLCVLPDTFFHSCLGIYYQARSRGMWTLSRTLRKWTTKGYEFEYNQKKLDEFGWFLVLKNQHLKDGAVFATEQDKQNYEALKVELEKNTQFKQRGTFDLPDGAYLILYQNMKFRHPVKK